MPTSIFLNEEDDDKLSYQLLTYLLFYCKIHAVVLYFNVVQIFNLFAHSVIIVLCVF